VKVPPLPVEVELSPTLPPLPLVVAPAAGMPAAPALGVTLPSCHS
jgi:hypothetical protein